MCGPVVRLTQVRTSSNQEVWTDTTTPVQHTGVRRPLDFTKMDDVDSQLFTYSVTFKEPSTLRARISWTTLQIHVVALFLQQHDVLYI